MIRLNSASYKAGKFLVKNLSFHLSAGNIGVVLGGRNSGKSDFLRVCMGKLSVSRGKVFLNGENVKEMIEAGYTKTLRDMGYVMQQQTLLDNLTIAGNVGLPISYHQGLPYEEMLEEIKPVLLKLNLWDRAEKFPHEVSQDAVKAAQLARAIIQKPKILFLDEPTAGDLDIDGFKSVMDCIDDCTANDVTILMATCSPSLLNKENIKKYICVNGMVLAWEDALNSADASVQRYIAKIEGYLNV